MTTWVKFIFIFFSTLTFLVVTNVANAQLNRGSERGGLGFLGEGENIDDPEWECQIKKWDQNAKCNETTKRKNSNPPRYIPDRSKELGRRDPGDLGGYDSSQSRRTDEQPSRERPTSQTPPDDDGFLPDQEYIAGVTAVVSGILIAGGVAANVVQAVAAAIAQALQAGIEVTAQEVTDAVLSRSGNDDAAVRRAKTNSGTEQAAPDIDKPPPIFDPNDGQAFETNNQGEYWAPDETGEWRWLPRQQAQAAAAALRAEIVNRGGEIAEHQRQTDAMMQQSRQDTQMRYARERETERLAKHATEQDRRRRNDLFNGIDKTLRNLPVEDRYHAMMAELANAQARGDKKMLEELWREIGTDRKAQLRKTEDASATYQRQAAGLGMIEDVAVVVRESSKVALAAGLGTVTGGTLTALEASVVAATAGGGLVAEGALEQGMQVKDGEVEFNSDEAVRGAARGARNAIGAMVGGVPTNGNALTAIGKIGFAATSDAAQTYADVHQQTGDREAAAGKARMAFGASLVQNATGEGWDEASRLAGKHAEASNIAEGLHNSINPTWADAIAQDKQMLHAAGKKATDLVGSVATDMAVNDQDFGTAVKNTVKGEIYGAAGGALADAYDKPNTDLTDGQRAVIDRLQGERMASDADATTSTGNGNKIQSARILAESQSNMKLSEARILDETPTERSASADAAHRDAQRVVWDAERLAKQAQAESDADPDNVGKKMDAREARSSVGQAEAKEMEARLNAREAYEAIRGSGSSADAPATHTTTTSNDAGLDQTQSKKKRDFLDRDPETLGETGRKAQEWLKSGKDFPDARGDDKITPPQQPVVDSVTDIKQKGRKEIVSINERIGNLRGGLSQLPQADPQRAQVASRIAELQKIRKVQGERIMNANDHRLSEIDMELKSLALPPTPTSIDPDPEVVKKLQIFGQPNLAASDNADDLSATLRRRELELEQQALKQESRTLKSDHVADQINTVAPAEGSVPAELPQRHASFDVVSDSTQIPAPDQITKAIRTHVDNKGKNSPYQSWTAKRQIAVSEGGIRGFGGDQLAIAHIPVQEFNQMLTNRHALPPAVVSAETMRSGNLIEQEVLIHRVPQQYWSVETPEFRQLMSNHQFVTRNGLPAYRDANRNEFVILYRSMRQDQFPDGTSFIKPRK